MPARTLVKSLTSAPQVIVGVVDDDAGIRTAMEDLLSAYGYCAETFDSAAAFLEVAETSEAMCLLVDVHLGDTCGLELARELAAAGLKYPIIFMSGRGDERIRSQATAVGGIAFLNKPFPAEMLMQAIIKATASVARMERSAIPVSRTQ
jgi:FixJ family two-component response regulator